MTFGISALGPSFGGCTCGSRRWNSHHQRVRPPARKETSMKKSTIGLIDDLRRQYTSPDFPKLTRGKYAGKLRTSSNVIILDPGRDLGISIGDLRSRRYRESTLNQYAVDARKSTGRRKPRKNPAPAAHQLQRPAVRCGRALVPTLPGANFARVR